MLNATEKSIIWESAERLCHSRYELSMSDAVKQCSSAYLLLYNETCLPEVTVKIGKEEY